jgi:hypothetical protein
MIFGVYKMKKFLVTALCGLGLVVGVANAGHDDMMSDDMMMSPDMMMKMGPVCKEAMEHQKKVRPEIDRAIKENNAQKVGELVIADHKFMEDFCAKHPECKQKMKDMKMAMKGKMMAMEKDKMAPPAN